MIHQAPADQPPPAAAPLQRPGTKASSKRRAWHSRGAVRAKRCADGITTRGGWGYR